MPQGRNHLTCGVSVSDIASMSPRKGFWRFALMAFESFPPLFHRPDGYGSSWVKVRSLNQAATASGVFRCRKSGHDRLPMRHSMTRTVLAPNIPRWLPSRSMRRVTIRSHGLPSPRTRTACLVGGILRTASDRLRDTRGVRQPLHPSLGTVPNGCPESVSGAFRAWNILKIGVILSPGMPRLDGLPLTHPG